MREIAGKRGSGGIWLERLGDSDPVLWCEDADGKRGSVWIFSDRTQIS